MENKLVVQDGISQDDFKMLVNNASQMQSKPNFPDLIKFDAVDGVWVISKGKDENDKTIFEPIGEKVELHIVNHRKTAQVKEGDEITGYSREVQDNFFEIKFKDGHIESGIYKNLKDKYGDSLIYTVILYAFYQDKLVRVKLSGGKLSKWFDYTKSFINDAIACWNTVMTKGHFIEKTKMVKYYEIEINRGEEITDREIIIKRINDCNTYLQAYAQSLKKTEEVEAEIVPEIQDEQIVKEVENIEF